MTDALVDRVAQSGAATAPVSATAVPPSRRLHAFDGLRGLAALLVVLAHAGQIFGLPDLVPYGFFAVDLFFLMSGYVIAAVYERKFADGLGPLRFLVIRYARLGPAIWMGTLVGMLVYHLVDPAMSVAGLALFSVVLIPAGGARLFPLNQPFWSLFYEIAANIGHAALARRYARPALFAGVALCGVAYAVAIVFARTTQFGSADSVLRGFLRVGWSYGMGVALYHAGAVRWTAVPSLPAPVVFLIALVVIAMPRIVPTAPYSVMVLFIGLPALICLALRARVGEALRPLCGYAGDISYPLYAIHYPLLVAAAYLLGQATALAWLAPIAVGIVVAATIVEYGYDRPLRLWLRPVARG